ncbi:MAG: helix-turn-helix domain-containing protein [Janthinobacterium lividum]
MKQMAKDFQVLDSVPAFTRHFGYPSPTHPLLTIIDLAAQPVPPAPPGPALRQLYLVALKRDFKGRLRYGHGAYDFSEGVLGFYAPGQLCTSDGTADTAELSGWLLAFHPDLLARYPLGQKISSYQFFSYQVHEALHLSAREEGVLNELAASLRRESEQPADAFSQAVLVAQLDLLLSYANRYYHRQFQTRRVGPHDLLSRFEALLAGYLGQAAQQPLPTVQHFADALHVSPAYLADMLRTHTGQNTQQHIHQALIEKAKSLLLSTSLSISETAFQLGFEYPQYFSRLFKRKTGQTPAEFRLSSN